MISRALRPTLLAALLVGSLAAAVTPTSDTAMHFGLAKSAPEAEATVEAVTEVRLWFTEAPDDGTTSIRVIDSANAVVHTGDVTQDPEDDRVFFVELHHPLSAGSYTVAWRGMGADGHVVRESFPFTVTGQ